MINIGNNQFMTAALKEAKIALEQNEIPVGSVITHNDKIIAKAHNMRETNKNSLHHAEILAIDKACMALNAWRLNECDIYVTLEPCLMCAGAILNTRFKRVYFGVYDKQFGASKYLNTSNIEVYGGICEEECQKIINIFFGKIRKKETKYEY